VNNKRERESCGGVVVLRGRDTGEPPRADRGYVITTTQCKLYKVFSTKKKEKKKKNQQTGTGTGTGTMRETHTTRIANKRTPYQTRNSSSSRTRENYEQHGTLKGTRKTLTEHEDEQDSRKEHRSSERRTSPYYCDQSKVQPLPINSFIYLKNEPADPPIRSCLVSLRRAAWIVLLPILAISARIAPRTSS
jgi:hypothetical protein